MSFIRSGLSLAGVILAAALSACSNEDNVGSLPSVRLTAQDSEIGAVNFLVSAENADRCAYVCLSTEETVPTTAEEIFAQGTEIVITNGESAPVHVPVNGQSTYAIIAAAANKDGDTAVSNKIELAPLENTNPNPGQIEVTFKAGQLLYLPNGMLLLNLYESENTEIYQTQLKFEGIENNGALRNNSRLLAEGLYKTVSPAYLINEDGDSDIDNNLPAGTLIKIERGTEGKVILTVTGTLAESNDKFAGSFIGLLEDEIELKEYSLNNVVFNETAGPKWDAESGEIQVPMRSSSSPELVQFTLVFRSETENLKEGDYQISSSGEPGTVSLAKAYMKDIPMYVDGGLVPAEIGYKSGSVNVEFDSETNTYKLTIEAQNSYDILYAEYAGVDFVYGGSLTGSFYGEIGESGGGDPDPDYSIWQDTYSETPAVVSYGLTSDLEGYERSYVGSIDLQPDTEGEANIRLFFVNKAPEPSDEGFDPSQIEFIPGHSFATIGQDLDAPVFPYIINEGDIDLSYDSASSQWTLHFEGFFKSPMGQKIKIIADYAGPMDGFTAL